MMDEAALRERMKKITGDPERRMILARLIDSWTDSVYTNSFTASLILGESNQALAKALFSGVRENRLHFWGAYPEAKRALACFLPDYLDESLLPDLCEDDLAAIRCHYAKQDDLSHRDFLGSLIGLGITRESIGDILPDNNAGTCDIILSRNVLPLVLLEYKQAGRSTVNVESIPTLELNVPEQNFRELTASVASLRLDAILAAAFKMSRTDAVDTINAGRVLVNGFQVDKADHKLDQGDTIACRGLGKFRLSKIKGNSRKGRTIIDLSIYA